MGARKKPTDIGNSVYIIYPALTLEEYRRREDAAPKHHVRLMEERFHAGVSWGDA